MATYSDNTVGFNLPPYTAFVVEVGTLDNPEKVKYFCGSYDTQDGELDTTLATATDYLNAGFIHVATLHVDTINNTTTLVYVNPNVQTSRLDINRNNF